GGREGPARRLEGGGAPAARDHGPVEVRQLAGLPDLGGVHAQAPERLGVLREVALESEDPDAHGCALAALYQPRVASRSFSPSVDISIPGMASPRSSETLARTSASR